MKNQAKKATYVGEYQEKLEKAKVVVMTGIEGLTVDQMTTLRREIRKTGAEMRVVKNNLVSRALTALGKAELGKTLTGSTAITFGFQDPVTPVKALFDFAIKANKLKFKGGMLGAKLLSNQDLEALSRLPGREQLLSMVCSAMIGPIRNLVSVTQGPIRKFVYALQAIKEKKAKDSPVVQPVVEPVASPVASPA